jgi:hypothetical protein
MGTFLVLAYGLDFLSGSLPHVGSGPSFYLKMARSRDGLQDFDKINSFSFSSLFESGILGLRRGSV